MIRVLVAEDSPTARELLTGVLRSDPAVAVVGEAADGIAAVAMTLRLRPHVVTMDVAMPGQDGFQATREIMIAAPTPIVLLSSSLAASEVATSMRALEAGALMVLGKPPGPGAPDFAERARRFVDTVKAMSQVKVVRRRAPRSPPPVPAPPALPLRHGSRLRAVAIAASTGGPAALAQLLAELPGDFPAPLLVVQHIAPGFTRGFASWLAGSSALPVVVAEHREPLRPGRVYLAPDDHHLGVTADRAAVKLSDAAPLGGFRPSASHLFASVAAAFGSSAVGLMLTGMGDDGVAGLRALREAGGRVIAQDEDSSVVFGMPGAARAAGLVDQTLPLAAMARQLRALS